MSIMTNFGSAIKMKEKISTKRKNVQVVVRTRPLSDQEYGSKNKNIIGCDSISKIITLKTNSNERYTQRNFGPFDKVFGPETTQIQIYNDVVAPLMKEVLNGYNCTVFAYGQTGSGKTFTMEGKHDESCEYSWEHDPTSGIIPRSLHQIFTELGNDEIDFTVRVSYVELYNEQIYDLLSTSETSQIESLRIFDDKNKGVLIAGAEEVIVRTRDEVYELLRRGAEKRRTAATLMNITSSRSHSVFTVSVMIREPGLVNGEELLRQGKLNLVDLAGSENIGRSGATEQRAREAGNINTSLLALGRVINALTMNAPHIPYRESKLTRILQDSLGGKTITTIIATLSPSSSNADESTNTLEYAQRAKNIKNNPEVNQKITKRGLLKEYNEEIERLRRDLLAAREKHGIYLDKENYDNMLGTIEEKSAKVDELEMQLSTQLQKAKMLVEDFEVMDTHYQSVYEKCRAALLKLEGRKVQVEKLNKELAQMEDNWKAATCALSESENSFVRLRAQASKFQNTCVNFYEDLDRLHVKLDLMKDVVANNDQLVTNIANNQIAQLDNANTKLMAFSQASDNRMDEGHKLIADCAEQTTNHSSQVMKTFSELYEKLAKFKAEMNEQLTSCGEMIKNQANEAMNYSKFMQNTNQSLMSAVDEQKSLTTSLTHELTNTFNESTVEMEDFLQREYKRIQSTGLTPSRQETTSFMEELVDMPPARKLLDHQKQLVTPRRTSFFRTRDSILDSSEFKTALISPHTLKSYLPGQAMTTKLELVEEAETSVESNVGKKRENGGKK